VTIDAHAHVLVKDYPAEDGFPTMAPVDGDTARDMVFGAFEYRAKDVWFATERRIEAMDAAGVDEEIVSPMPPLLNYAIETATALTLHRHINEAIAGYVAAGGGRIHGLGIVPMQDPDVAAAELSRIAELGLRGAEIGSHINGTPIGDARYRVVFQEAVRLGLGLFVHTLPRVDEVGIDAAHRGSIGVGIEGTRGAASIVLGGHAEHCAPDRVLFSHAAGGLPSILARADYFWATKPQDERPPLRPSELARRFTYDSMVFDPAGLRFIIDYLGADRITLGTDFPAMARPEPLDSLLDPLGLDAAERALITEGNARRFLGIDAVSL